MKTVAIHFDQEVSAEELRQALEPAGFIVRVVGDRLVASRVPAFLRRDPERVMPPRVVAVVTPLVRPKGARRA